MLNPKMILAIEFNLSDGFQSIYSLSSVMRTSLSQKAQNRLEITLEMLICNKLKSGHCYAYLGRWKE